MAVPHKHGHAPSSDDPVHHIGTDLAFHFEVPANCVSQGYEQWLAGDERDEHDMVGMKPALVLFVSPRQAVPSPGTQACAALG
jgi:hypothetical protein